MERMTHHEDAEDIQPCSLLNLRTSYQIFVTLMEMSTRRIAKPLSSLVKKNFFSQFRKDKLLFLF